MTIPEAINVYLGTQYKMEYNAIHGVLTIKQPIGVWEFLKVKYIIYKKQMLVKNIIIQAE